MVSDQARERIGTRRERSRPLAGWFERTDRIARRRYGFHHEVGKVRMGKTSKVDLIVRRGALRRFHKLSQKTADLPVTVLWDRRTSDRRSAEGAGPTERRRKERRKQPPFTWDVSDFVVATRVRPKKRKEKA